MAGRRWRGALLCWVLGVWLLDGRPAVAAHGALGAASQPASQARSGSAEPDGPAADTAAAMRSRLGNPAPLGPEEIGLALAEIARTMRGRTVQVTDGRETMPLDPQGQNVVFAVLSGTLPVQDVGLQTIDGTVVRGLRSPATPARSEVGAKQTLWIDVQRLLPRRFELLYEVPGFGDASFDFRIE